MKVNINQNAPIIAKQKIRINAPAVRVWSVLTEINNWPNWQAAVKKAHLKSSLKEGAAFSWNNGGVPLHSTVHTCEKFHAFGWTGKTIGSSAIHNWSIESLTDGTMVFVEESLQGFLPSIFKKKFQKNLENGMSKNLRELKDASEK
jgi:uncharacterized protein YndB with AHSA1/START domain